MSSSDLIDVTAQPAIASWTHPSGARRSLDALRFHIYHDPSTKTAFFKLRATVTFKATGGRPKRTTAAWLHIAPERVDTVILEDENNVDEGMSRRLGANTVCWHFRLNRPGTLVLPPDYDLKSKGHQSDDPLDGLWGLAPATAFSVYACLPARTVSRGRLMALCDAGSLGNETVGTTADAASTDARLASNKHAADTASLYGGKGGQIVELDRLQTPGPAGNGASPPPYSDIGPGPPFVADAPTGKKRRRASSGASATESRQDDSKVIEDKKAFARALKDVFRAELKAELMSELRADLKAELKDELKKELLSEVMPEIERRILDRVEERLLEHSDDLEKQLYDLRHEVGSTVYSEVEDQTYMARKELEDFVHEEMQEAQRQVEDRIVDRLEGAHMNIRFNDR
ncbi:hypothetical protein KVR01_011327 [Diaporthe batatas]|uniref:uncharacterized protein n=1 Tax=Diaporthe batatas TaxID=748121 RepID=UPI001D055913|nr:uncharacterized protein KVR01_011327 [Diaporthe batatas]KAG8158884.1 hypothetical protein KVR01_011327 [Diaporthe batatas]